MFFFGYHRRRVHSQGFSFLCSSTNGKPFFSFFFLVVFNSLLRMYTQFSDYLLIWRLFVCALARRTVGTCIYFMHQFYMYLCSCFSCVFRVVPFQCSTSILKYSSFYRWGDMFSLHLLCCGCCGGFSWDVVNMIVGFLFRTFLPSRVSSIRGSKLTNSKRKWAKRWRR